MVHLELQILAAVAEVAEITMTTLMQRRLAVRAERVLLLSTTRLLARVAHLRSSVADFKRKFNT
jgi:hypothetical protein